MPSRTGKLFASARRGLQHGMEASRGNQSRRGNFKEIVESKPASHVWRLSPMKIQPNLPERPPSFPLQQTGVTGVPPVNGAADNSGMGKIPMPHEIDDDSLTKRDFLKLTGASMALAGVGLTGCRRPASSLVPFSKGVEWTVPGKFLYYATSMPTRFGAIPLVATTVDGRPTKLEGNPIHPASNGATDCFAQASVLDLYDPHRAKTITENGRTVEAATFEDFLARVNKDGGIAFLVGKKNSPTRDRLRAELEKKFPALLWCEYEPLGDSDATTASNAGFGAGLKLRPEFKNADVILSLDNDFLNPSVADGSSGFFGRRQPDQIGKLMNRLYVVENHFSMTGGMADHRLRGKVSEMFSIVLQLATHVANKTGNRALASLITAFPKFESVPDGAWIAECANDLIRAADRSLVLTGPQAPSALQALGHAINNALGNLGTTVVGFENVSPATAGISELAKTIAAGAVKTLFIFEGNPIYNAPADLNFASLLSKVPDVVRLGLFEDETSKASRWHVPAAHYLESWGDARTSDGTYSAIQPMILPLWGGHSELDILAKLLGLPKTDGPELVRETFNKICSSSALDQHVGPTSRRPNSDARQEPSTNPEAVNFDQLWTDFLRNGFLPNTQFPTADLKFSSDSPTALAKEFRAPSGGLELVFLQSSSVDDGRYANNSWLQETPDFVTKLTWDNAALVSQATAANLGIRSGDLLELSDGIKTIEVAAILAPGHADDSISIALGYGRKGVSALISDVGFDAYPLRRSGSPRFTTGISIKPTGRTYALALTQEHHNMEDRDLVRVSTFARFQQDPTFAQAKSTFTPPEVPLLDNSPPLTSQEQWGMTVDLNSCIGCNACVVACQAENNVPVVGKEQILNSRDMAWIRLDRYFSGNSDNPEMLPQPIMCQHCENAPCETVCPVNATVHSEDGLNLMTYNRCIGTRYCANNCPWKVRRFNFFAYNERPLDQLYYGPLASNGMAESLKMAKNPNVTVRMRGVMEKCTFCIQRIEEAKIARLVKAGPNPTAQIPISTFQSACQQACPSNAIVFGNIADPSSDVARLRKSPRAYTMFDHLNTSPRVSYLARIKNPNPLMPA